MFLQFKCHPMSSYLRGKRRHRQTTAGPSEAATAGRGRPSLCQTLCQLPCWDGPFGPHNITGTQLLPLSHTGGNGGFEVTFPRLQITTRGAGAGMWTPIWPWACALNCLHPRLHVRREIPCRGMRFSLRGTKDGIMCSIRELQGKERLLNTSHSPLIIGAVLKQSRLPWGAGQYHRGVNTLGEAWPGPCSHFSSECLSQAGSKTKVVRPTPHGTPWKPLPDTWHGSMTYKVT